MNTAKKLLAIGITILFFSCSIPSTTLSYGSSCNLSDKTQNNTTYIGDNTLIHLDTTLGAMKIVLYDMLTPVTVKNFLNLVSIDFYDGLVFHRVLDDFVIQGGGYDVNGILKESPFGTIDLEIHHDARHVNGAIGMARASDHNSATSQFYICDGPQHFLDDNYAVFGRVVEGFDVLQDISSVETNQYDWPVEDIIINDISVLSQKTWYVDDDNIDGPGDGTQEHPFQFIQDAIDNATYADTIFVYNGTYYENVVINKALNLIGENKASTIIDGRKLNNSITLVSEGITVSGFSITNGSKILKKEVENWSCAGIRIIGSNNKIIDNIIYNNTLGIFCKQATNLSICQNTFYNDGINIYPYELERIRPTILRKYFVHNIYNNTVNGKPLLYYLDKSDFKVPSEFGQLIAVNCKNLEIKNANVNQSDFEVMLVFCSNCLIEKCNFESNDGAFTLLSSYNNVLRYNFFKTSFHGLLLDYGSKFNTIEYNVFSKNKYCGVMIEYFSNFNHVSKNNFYENYAGAFLDKSFGNKYRKNYWDDWSGVGPVIIYDHIDFYKELHLPFSIIPLGFDWFPAKGPYAIPLFGVQE
ncbi:MAG: peptidylprolyl isomerase [Candidatus Thermoplasmatota archaeon]|nr:peptidylprolyl isomerase [Candidatus Thermoplasmatota archaeon]